MKSISTSATFTPILYSAAWDSHRCIPQVSKVRAWTFLAYRARYYFQQITNIHLWYKSIQEAEAFYVREVRIARGFEWTSEGHMNGYNTDRASRTPKGTSPLHGLHADGIATFNHPNPDIQPNWSDSPTGSTPTTSYACWRSAQRIQQEHGTSPPMSRLWTG